MRTCDVVVMGGGPAGAVAALRLARLGRDVVLLEAATFPRPHVGISLSPGLRKQLNFLGLAHLLDHPAHRAGVAISRRWESEVFEPVKGVSTLLADRGVLDADLLRAARRAGVEVLQPARVTGWLRRGKRWFIDAAAMPGPLRVETGFLIDATGRKSSARRSQRGPSTMAICASWSGGNLPEVRISAQPSSWIWAAPTAADATEVMCFVDPKAFRRMAGGLLERYHALVRASEVLPRLDTRSHGRLSLCDATPVISVNETPSLLRIGDADSALDPLSSSGVQAAVASALAAVPVVNTLISRDGDGAAAEEFWASRRARRMEQHLAWGSAHCNRAYARMPNQFWADRAGEAPPIPPPGTPLPTPGQMLELSRSAEFRDAPCIEADRVVRAPCVQHPGLSEPAVFSGGVRVAPLMRQAIRRQTAGQLILAWSSTVGSERALSLLSWAWQRGVVVAPRDHGGRAQPRETHAPVGRR